MQNALCFQRREQISKKQHRRYAREKINRKEVYQVTEMHTLHILSVVAGCWLCAHTAACWFLFYCFSGRSFYVWLARCTGHDSRSRWGNARPSMHKTWKKNIETMTQFGWNGWPFGPQILRPCRYRSIQVTECARKDWARGVGVGEWADWRD